MSEFYLWWSRTGLPPLAPGDVILHDTRAFRHDARFWQSKRGRLVLTKERLIFLPTLARMFPWKPFGGSWLDIGREEVESCRVGRSTFGQLLKMAPSNSNVTIELGNRHAVFYTPIAEEICRWSMQDDK